jgi:putative transposase
MVGMARNLDFDDPATEIALFRYGLIAGLVHEPLASGKPPKGGGKLEEGLRQIAAKRYEIPHSKRTRVSLSSVRRYLKAFQAGGFEALKPHARSDAGVPRAFDKAVLERAVALREAQPERTTPMIVEHLKRDGSAAMVNPHTLTTHLRKLGKTRQLLAKAPDTRRRFEREHVNSLWQSDALQGPWLLDPERPDRRRRAHLFAVIDDYSRLVPFGQWFFDEQLPRLERVLKVAILRRGLPKAIYVDNGSVFVATQFGAACASLGIKKLHSEPYQPEGRGKIERFFGTVREQFLPEADAASIATLDDLNTSFWAWLDQVYHARVHSETGQTPFERFTSGPGFDQIVTPDPETLRQAFLWRAKRRVSKTATIELQGNTYYVDLGLAWPGQFIEVRFDPFDLSKLDLYRDGKPLAPVTVVHYKRQFHLQIEKLVSPQLRKNAAAGSDFLSRLRDEHDTAQRKLIGTIHFSKLSQE